MIEYKFLPWKLVLQNHVRTLYWISQISHINFYLIKENRDNLCELNSFKTCNYEIHLDRHKTHFIRAWKDPSYCMPSLLAIKYLSSNAWSIIIIKYQWWDCLWFLVLYILSIFVFYIVTVYKPPFILFCYLLYCYFINNKTIFHSTIVYILILDPLYYVSIVVPISNFDRKA